MHIGLIGGIGVSATLVYYRRLTTALDALGAKADITIVHADARTLVRNNTDGNVAAQVREYAPLLDRLKAAGADCAAITSLGGHFCFEETQAISPLPLVSGVTPLDAYFTAKGIGTVGLLGTQVVMRTRLYGQLQATQGVALDDEIEELGRAYQNMAIAGEATDALRDLFVDAGARLVKDHGADAIVLAGTDLGLVFDDLDPGYRVVNALDVHVAELAAIGAGHKPVPAQEIAA